MERAERSLQAPLQICRKAAPPKKCREVSTTVVLNHGGFDEVVSRFGGRWILPNKNRKVKKLNENVEDQKKNKKKKGQRSTT